MPNSLFCALYEYLVYSEMIFSAHRSIHVKGLVSPMQSVIIIFTMFPGGLV